MAHVPWWLLVSVIHGVFAVALWHYRRTDHPWLWRLLVAQWVALGVRGVLAATDQGGLALLGASPMGSAFAAALLIGTDVVSWAILVLAAEHLARGMLNRAQRWLPVAAFALGAAAGVLASVFPSSRSGVLFVCYGVLVPSVGSYTAVRLVQHLRDCLRRRISVDLLVLAMLLFGARLTLAWVEHLELRPLVHPGFLAVFHIVSTVALLGLYLVTKRSVRSQTVRE